MLYLKNAMCHFKLVCKHKVYVFKNCCVAGMPIVGLLHDLSKFTPIEFFESVKYYQGDSSPINACKKDKGYSQAWLHHKGINRHHYEYWEDNFDSGGEALQMPFRYALELICDYLAAGMAYSGDKFTYQGEYDWWLDKLKKNVAMHTQTKLFITYMLRVMALENSNRILKKKSAKKIYEIAERQYQKRK